MRPRGEPRFSFENIGFIITFFEFLFMIGSHIQDLNVGKLKDKWISDGISVFDFF